METVVISTACWCAGCHQDNQYMNASADVRYAIRRWLGIGKKVLHHYPVAER
jgi:hypothetical protein